MSIQVGNEIDVLLNGEVKKVMVKEIMNDGDVVVTFGETIARLHRLLPAQPEQKSFLSYFRVGN